MRLNTKQLNYNAYIDSTHRLAFNWKRIRLHCRHLHSSFQWFYAGQQSILIGTELLDSMDWLFQLDFRGLATHMSWVQVVIIMLLHSQFLVVHYLILGLISIYQFSAIWLFEHLVLLLCANWTSRNKSEGLQYHLLLADFVLANN
jgi:hypothetical protein